MSLPLSLGLSPAEGEARRGMAKLALEEAGLIVGLGSWRPEYGRFLLVEWTVNR